MKRIFSSMLSAILILFQVGCAAKGIQNPSRPKWGKSSFDPDYTYEVTFRDKDKTKYRIDGSQLEWQGEKLVWKEKYAPKQAIYTQDHVQKIRGQAKWGIAPFDPNYTYKISLNNKEKTKYVLSGAKLKWQGDNLVLKLKDGETQLRPQQIDRILGVGNQRIGSYAGIGAGIGAGVGVLTGVLTSTLGSSCDHAEEREDCEALSVLLTTVVALASGGVGALLGMGIGAAIPKKPKIEYFPQDAYQAAQNWQDKCVIMAAQNLRQTSSKNQSCGLAD